MQKKPRMTLDDVLADMRAHGMPMEKGALSHCLKEGIFREADTFPERKGLQGGVLSYRLPLRLWGGAAKPVGKLRHQRRKHELFHRADGDTGRRDHHQCRYGTAEAVGACVPADPLMWPRLVPGRVCKTPCRVVLTNGTGEDGAPLTASDLTLNCNWQDKPRQIKNAERELIQLAGAALFDGDIAPQLDVLTGAVEIYGKSWEIYQGSKCRNPDGTVNYTRLELM